MSSNVNKVVLEEKKMGRGVGMQKNIGANLKESLVFKPRTI